MLDLVGWGDPTRSLPSTERSKNRPYVQISMPMYVPVRPIPAEQCTTIGDFGLVASVAMYLDDATTLELELELELEWVTPSPIRCKHTKKSARIQRLRL